MLSCVDSLLTMGDKYQQMLVVMFKKPNQQFTSVCEVMAAFLCGVPIFVWVLINR